MTLPLWTANEEILPCDGSALLIRDFLGNPRADDCFDALINEVPWESHDLMLFGRTVTEPRLSAWIADTGVAYRYSGVTRTPLPWNSTLAAIRDDCGRATSVTFNSVLANLYRSGDDAMGWHADDEPELGLDPTIASVSLGAERRFDFRHRHSGDLVSVVLPHDSLLIMSGPTQTHWMHRIARTKKSHDARINLTYRYVVSVKG